MLPTSARVAQEVYEPLIGIQYPMLCSRMGDTWQIGTTSIREDHKIASGLRFIHWCHASPNVQAKQNPKNDPTVRVHQHIEDQLTRAGSEADDILALTTTRGATNLRNYFYIAGKKANAETAVKIAGATAKHCIVIHGDSTFLTGEALCGETGFCCGFWTPNWCPEKSLFSIPGRSKKLGKLVRFENCWGESVWRV